MKTVVLGGFVALLAISVRAERVAYVFSGWQKERYKCEYDAHFGKLGWTCTKFLNTELPALSGKLADYDVVVAGSVANYANTVSVKPYAAVWRQWLEAGGALIVTDANYPSVLGSWVGALEPEFACTAVTCTAHKKRTTAACAVTLASDPLLMCPHPLGRLIRDRYIQWTHLEGLDDDWRKPILCSDGRPTFAYRPVGKGIVVLLSAAELSKSRIGEALLANVALWRQMRAQGLELASVKEVGEMRPVLSASVVRKHLYADDPLQPCVTCCPPAWATNRLRGVEWRIDRGAWSLRKALAEAWKIPLGSLSEGRHEIAFRLCYDEGYVASLGKTKGRLAGGEEELRVEFFRRRDARYRFRSDGVLLEDGKAFFPLGFYYVGWKRTDAERDAAVADMSAWGYNTVHMGVRKDEPAKDSYGKFLDNCARLGMRVVTEFEDGVEPEPIIRRYREKPAVMAWNPGDEPARKGLLAEDMFRLYDRFKQLDPEHFVYTVICVPSRYAKFAPGTDVLAPDVYPVPTLPISNVSDCLAEARIASGRAGCALWGVCQAFGGQHFAKISKWKRPPDGREFRGMSYLALMAGAKGLMYYVYHDGCFVLLKEPELLAAVKAFPAEMSEVAPFVLAGECRQLAKGEKGLYSAMWTDRGQDLFVAVNTTTVPVRVNVPFGDGRLLYGERKPSNGGFCELGALERIVILGTR